MPQGLPAVLLQDHELPGSVRTKSCTHSGLTADYVARETKRAIAGTGGPGEDLSGIDIDVPTRAAPTSAPSPTTSGKLSARRLGAGADGVVLSREYVEMWLANLSAAGETLREIWGRA